MIRAPISTSDSVPGLPAVAQPPRTIAIMQPYFIPYAGYFRLFAASDLFVIYDCVQFPRRGWVHRNRLVDSRGTERWLTLPLAKAPRDVIIRDLRFPPDAARIIADRLRNFPLVAGDGDSVDAVLAALCDVRGTPLDYIERLLQRVVTYYDLPWRVMRSSTLSVPREFRGQDRILEIVRRLGAKRYINASGGRDLYDQAAFADAGIELRFLSPYSGPRVSVLTRILVENRDDLVRDLGATSIP